MNARESTVNEPEKSYRILHARIAEIERHRNDALGRCSYLAGEVAVLTEELRRNAAVTTELAAKAAALEKMLVPSDTPVDIVIETEPPTA